MPEREDEQITEPAKELDSFSFSGPQRRLYEALSDHSSDLAAMYRGALQVLEEPSIEDRFAMSAHNFRELIEKLPSYIELPRARGDSNYNPERREVFLEWARGQDPSPTPLAVHTEKKLSNEWSEVREFFLSVCHHGKEPNLDEFVEQVRRLEALVLPRLVPQPFENQEVLDDIIQGAEQNDVNVEHVRKAVDAFEHGSDRRYFYQKISSPDWIRPLKEEGQFDAPPEPVYEGEYVSYPGWPEGQYLLRIAEKTDDVSIQRLILEIILDLPATKNERADRLLTEIALQLPPGMAYEWAKEERKTLEERKQLSSLKTDALGKLVLLVAQEDVKFALYMMRDLLRVFPDPRDLEEQPFALPHPQARMEEYRYRQVVEDYIPELIEAGELEAVNILICPLLESVIRLSQQESDGSVDFSTIWRPAIEKEGRGHGLDDTLTTALRDAAEQVAGSMGKVTEVVQLLEEQEPPRPVFRRVALHVLRLHADATQEEVVERLLDPELLGDSYTWHEYALLLKESLPELSEEQRQEIIENILAGPQLEEEVVEGSSKDEVREHIDWWKLQRLALLEDYLSGEAAGVYRALREQHGKYENPEGGDPGISTWVGPVSPKTSEELAEMPPEEVVEFVAGWDPPQERRAASPEGLSRALSGAIENKPANYAPLADRFRGLDPTYVKSFIAGLEKAGGGFNWVPVLELCEWVVTQPRRPEERQIQPSQSPDMDPDWGWTRKRIASLLKKGLSARNIPYELRERVWGIIETLVEDPEPTPEYEAKYGGDNMNPLTLSINTVRGEALHATVQYALWVQENELGDDEKKEPTAGGFEHVPEARRILERHLDLEREPSEAARAVYGMWLPQLYLIDSTWTVEKRPEIFPPDKERYRAVAWDTYLYANRPYDAVFEAFRDEYLAAIDRDSNPHTLSGIGF